MSEVFEAIIKLFTDPGHLVGSGIRRPKGSQVAYGRIPSEFKEDIGRVYVARAESNEWMRSVAANVDITHDEVVKLLDRVCDRNGETLYPISVKQEEKSELEIELLYVSSGNIVNEPLHRSTLSSKSIRWENEVIYEKLL